jgi:tetraacyldisaccharide 4'-kinase
MKDFLYAIATDQKQGIGVSMLKVVLALMSILYSGLLALRNAAYKMKLLKSQQLSRPVISVGNITLGGVGKTPLVENIVQMIQTLNKRPAILMRGYMPRGSAQIASDEARMLEERLPKIPVLVGSNRVESAKNVLSQRPVDIFILDDGYQHLKLKRDCNVLVIDTTNPFGNRWLIPRGILREHLSSIQRADLIVLSKADLGRAHLESIKTEIRKHSSAPILETIHTPHHWVNLKTQEVLNTSHKFSTKAVVLSALGNPHAYEMMLKRMGVEVVKAFRFLDHHSYTSADIHEVNTFCHRENIKYVLTTHKDSVKLKTLLPLFHEEIEVFYLDIQIGYLQGKEILVERISALLQR